MQYIKLLFSSALIFVIGCSTAAREYNCTRQYEPITVVAQDEDDAIRLTSIIETEGHIDYNTRRFGYSCTKVDNKDMRRSTRDPLDEHRAR